MTRTVFGTLLPGAGMLGTRRHWVGVVTLALLVAGSGGLFAIVRTNPAGVAGIALQARWMFAIAIGLALVAIAWIAIITGTYLITRPTDITKVQRRIGAGLVSLLSFLVSAPLAVGSAYSLETALLSGGLFGDEGDSQSQTRPTLDTKDPWTDKPRVNILLLGGDTGEGRDIELGVRTDTMMLVSIDTATGNSVIVQLPRNLQHPIFPENSRLAEAFPYGFNNGGESMLNAVWQDVPSLHPELFNNTDYPGADALKWAVEGITGQRVDYFVLVNIDGLVNLVDAMGGVTVNVNFPIAISGSDENGNCGEGGWIPDGPNRHLDGYQAMWYARSRCNTPTYDFGRMQRQSCLVDAVIKQADAATMVTRYEGIAQAAAQMVSTDIPQEHLPAIVELANRVQKSRQISRLSFDPFNLPWYSSEYPDFAQMRQAVSNAIAASIPASSPSGQPSSIQQPAPPPGETSEAPTTEAPPSQPGNEPTMPSNAGSGESTAAPPAENISDTCAYRQEQSTLPVPDTVPRYTPPAATEPSGSPR